MKIPAPTIKGFPAPGLEVVIRFEDGQGWQAIIRNHATGHEYGRGTPRATFREAAHLAAESLEAAR